MPDNKLYIVQVRGEWGFFEDLLKTEDEVEALDRLDLERKKDKEVQSAYRGKSQLPQEFRSIEVKKYWGRD